MENKETNEELKKEQPSLELQISEDQLQKIKDCEVLKINGMEFISRAKTTEMLIKFANEQLKEKEEELEEYTKALWKAEEQLTKSNEMAEKLAEALYSFKNVLDWRKENDIENWDNSDGDKLNEVNELLTEYQNSKK